MTTSSTTLPLAKVAGESFVSVGTELAYATDGTISLNDASVRTLAGAGGSGTVITMDSLRNKSSAAPNPTFVCASALTLEKTTTTPSSCFISINVNGTITISTSTGATGGPRQSDWYVPSGGTPGNSYWMRATIVSGSLTTGTTGSWLALSSNRLFGVTAPSNGVKSCTLYFQLATDSGGTNIIETSANVTLTQIDEL